MATKNSKGKNPSDTKAKAYAAREAAEKQEKRRERLVRVGLVIGVLIVVVGIIGGALFATKKSDAKVNTTTNSALPTGVTKENPGVSIGTAQTPSIEMFEDFQCPACAGVEKAYGATFNNLANSGKAKVTYYPMAFLDNNLRNDSSSRAASAFGCAVDAGKAEAYHSIVFKNQPAQEGAGYTQDQLKQFGKDAGIVGPAYDKFAACVDNLTYNGWGVAVNDYATSRGVKATPSIFVNGQALPREALASEQQLLAEIQKLAASSASPAPAAS